MSNDGVLGLDCDSRRAVGPIKTIRGVYIYMTQLNRLQRLAALSATTGVFGKESELDKMVDSHSMAGPFALIPSQNVFKSQARTPNLPATMCLSIMGCLVSRILYGGG